MSMPAELSYDDAGIETNDLQEELHDIDSLSKRNHQGEKGENELDKTRQSRWKGKLRTSL
jgi:hypothetical protein